MAVRQLMLLGALAAVVLTATRSEAARRDHASPARVICGQTGCFEVPPGCRGEIRRSGRGVVAVVICPR
jgi:hypothetical protein